MLNNKIVDEHIKAFNERGLGKNKVTIHQAHSKTELDEIVAMTARAFSDYALYDWMMEGWSEENRTAVNLFFTRFVQRMCLVNGYILYAKDPETSKIVGSAMFEHRNQGSNAFTRFVHDAWVGAMVWGGLLLGKMGSPFVLFKKEKGSFRQRMRGFEELERVHTEVMGAEQQHLYLIMLSAEPSQQKKGIGKTLLAALADLADSTRIPTYLETDAEHLKEFYERNGFEMRRFYALPDPIQPFVPNFGMCRPAPTDTAQGGPNIEGAKANVLTLH